MANILCIKLTLLHLVLQLWKSESDVKGTIKKLLLDQCSKVREFGASNASRQSHHFAKTVSVVFSPHHRRHRRHRRRSCRHATAHKVDLRILSDISSLRCPFPMFSALPSLVISEKCSGMKNVCGKVFRK